MYQLSSQEFWAHFFRDFRCGNCGSDMGDASRPRNFFERFVVPIFLLKMVRCGDCYHRSYRLMHLKVRARREEIRFDQARAVSDLVQAASRESQKQTPDSTEKRQRIA